MGLDSTGRAHWEGDLAAGSGTATLDSGAVGPMQVTWKARSEEHAGLTSPEELIAAAHAACLSMALSGELEKGGTPATRISTKASCSIDKVGGGFKITRMRLEVRGKVPGLDQAGFAKAAEAAKKGCPVSGALQGNVQLDLDARLE